MKYTPKPCSHRGVYLSGLLVLAGAAVFLLAAVLPVVRAILQTSGIMLWGLGIFYAVRYVMTEISYEIVPRDTSDDGDGEAVLAGGGDVTRLPVQMLDFVVRRGNSRRGMLIEARMALDELSYFAPLPREGGRNREPFQRYPRLHVYNYTVSVVPQIQYMAVFLDSAHNAVGLILEPDGKMTAALSGMVGRGED